MTSSPSALLGAAMISLLPLIAACHEASPEQLPVAPGATWSTSDSHRLSGHVFETTPGGEVPVAGIPLTIVVVGPSSCAIAPCAGEPFSRVQTVSGPDGRYAVDRLPRGSAVVLARSPLHRQVCGAGVDLFGTTPLNVRIAPKTEPYSLPMMTPLEVGGQVFETNSAGRDAIDGATVGVQHQAMDAPFLDVVTDSRGFYRACGIPAGWPIALSVRKPGYHPRFFSGTFFGSSKVDVELTPEG